MWLLDVNLPTALTDLLRSYGILAETAAARGWRELTNGELAQAAFRGGFRALLTRDRQFGRGTGRIIETMPELANDRSDRGRYHRVAMSVARIQMFERSPSACDGASRRPCIASSGTSHPEPGAVAA